jgi:hypothetical protein
MEDELGIEDAAVGLVGKFEAGTPSAEAWAGFASHLNLSFAQHFPIHCTHRLSARAGRNIKGRDAIPAL